MVGFRSARSGLAIGIQSLYKAGFSNPTDAGACGRWNDLRVFFGAGQLAFQDTDIYTNPTSPEGRYYVFPPFFAIICALLGALGWKVFVIIWLLASFASIAGALRLCVKIARPNASSFPLVTLAALSLILCARPIISDFQNGQVNLH